MSKKNKNKRSSAHQDNQRPKQAGLHKDWRAWVVVILMLTGIAIYVLSDNEAIQPGGGGDDVGMPAAE